MSATTVTLPRKHEAEFPEECVRCERDAEGKVMRFWPSAWGWFLWAASFGRGIVVRAPMCAECAWLVMINRWWRYLISLVFILIAIFVVWPLVERFFAPKWDRLGFLLAFIIAYLPWAIWQVIFPPALEVSLEGPNIDYDFRSEEYAQRFLELNEWEDY